MSMIDIVTVFDYVLDALSTIRKCDRKDVEQYFTACAISHMGSDASEHMISTGAAMLAYYDLLHRLIYLRVKEFPKPIYVHDILITKDQMVFHNGSSLSIEDAIKACHSINNQFCILVEVAKWEKDK